MVVIGGSAGSLELLLFLFQLLPEDSNTVFIVVLHRKNEQDSVLEDLFSYKTPLAIREVEDKDPIEAGTVYIAPPDYHLLVENEEMFSLDSSEKVNFSRPSIDVTFESVAETFGSRVTGVILSGASADGAAGIRCIREKGGLTLAQDPAEADFPLMPQEAIKTGAVKRVVSRLDWAGYFGPGFGEI